MKAALLALSITLWAPYQCGTEPNERPREDSAPKALWMLAEKFQQENNSAARETTLHQLVEVYPSSRYAERARVELGMPAHKDGDDDEEKVSSSGDEENPEKGDD
jgi:outer membrane protein assembly factor BamD (BamD/ComL family)